MRETVYQQVLTTDPSAAGMQVAVHALPKLVKDQLPKVSSVGVQLNQEDYKGLVTAAERLGLRLPAYPFWHYSKRRFYLPEGKVLFSATADEMATLNIGKEVSVRAWSALAMSQGRIAAAEAVIKSAANHLSQLCAELGTLEELMQRVPATRAIVPATWLTDPETAKPPTKGMVDPQAAAKLRAIILGEAA
ncbi:hypothetical protein D3C85_646000 [compost metagenome]